MNQQTKTIGKVAGVIANLVIVKTEGPVSQNEICYIQMGEERLMAEVIKVMGDSAYIQVFESTRGMKVGDKVEFDGHMLEVTLGPGLLQKNYDGLQNDLDLMEGTFLKRGEYTDAVNFQQEYDFKPLVKEGDEVVGGSWIGEVKENWIDHKIMIPFKFEDTYTVKSIKATGSYKTSDVVAVVTDSEGKDHDVSMVQNWPVKMAVKSYKEKPRPFKLMETGIRTIDSLNPMVEGGTGFIPGPFGCGKTVLQHALSKQAEADIVIVAACGERANEVVEIFKEFPEIDDPRTGRKLIERTIIIANTSNMPVAAREASVYTAMAIGEYYRAMGLRVLLLADSTSRWAQALREMSNRMEELPGQDAFPMDLSAIISNFYSRAGYVYLPNGETGSITFIGTVSPAGGNLKEPVTESTKKVARCFYALSQGRADSKRYPAIDPIDSYSKYLEYDEFQDYIKEKISDQWIDKIYRVKNALIRSREASEQINILGDDGVPLDYHITYWKGEIMDFAILQQDAFDPIDRVCPIDRQRYMMDIVIEIYHADFKFEHFEEVTKYFKRLINALKQMNYSEYQSDKFKENEKEARSLLDEKMVKESIA